MPESGAELRGISWSQTFPFVRLFRSFSLATALPRLGLALAGVLAIYGSGRLLDFVWTTVRGSAGVTVDAAGGMTEIEAYSLRGPAEMAAWRAQLSAARREAEVRAVDQFTDADAEQARKKLESQSAMSLVAAAQRGKIAAARTLISTRVQAGLAEIDKSGDAATRAERRRELRESADYLRIVLAQLDAGGFSTERVRGGALERISAAGAPPTPQGQPSEEQTKALEKHRKDNEDLAAAVAAAEALRSLRAATPRGPFISWIEFESRCFAAAIRGVCAGRLTYAGSAFSDQPSLIGSLASAGAGVMWLASYRPIYAALFGLVSLAILALVGGAISRGVAVQAARDESMSIGACLQFAREKLVQLLLAPLIPLAIFLLLSVFLIIGGLVGAIPFIGDALAGGFYILALLGGLGMALVLIALVAGFQLLWPTIAVEGSDAFDAITHAAGYVAQRIWHWAFYTILLLAYGGVAFVFVRLLALLLLKLTHTFTGIGMSLFGVFSSAQTDTVSKLDAIWSMPAWSEISILPTSGAVGFWGVFGAAPLGWGESLAYWLIAFWVFVVVGLVAAFVLSFYFSGGVMMYYLLRREVDATDYEEVYYEEDEGELPPPPPPAAETRGTPLPVMGAPATPPPAGH